MKQFLVNLKSKVINTVNNFKETVAEKFSNLKEKAAEKWRTFWCEEHQYQAIMLVFLTLALLFSVSGTIRCSRTLVGLAAQFLMGAYLLDKSSLEKFGMHVWELRAPVVYDVE